MCFGGQFSLSFACCVLCSSTASAEVTASKSLQNIVLFVSFTGTSFLPKLFFYSVSYTFVPTLLAHLPFLFGLAFGHTFGCFFDFQNDAKSPSSPVHRRMFSELFVFSVLGVPWRHFGGSLEPRDGGSGHKKVLFFTNFPF